MAQEIKEADLSIRTLDSDSRWQLVERIVATPGFARSARLSSFLMYVCRQSLLGRGSELNEQIIGEVVFERAVGYDPRDDNIVRSHASRLRLRLESYFRDEGAFETLRVAIPRGSYVPVFERVPSGSLSIIPESTPNNLLIPDAVPVSTQLQPLQKSYKVLAICSLLVATVSLFALAAIYLRSIHTTSRSETPTQKLWSQMFRSDQDTLIVPADVALVIGKLMGGRPVQLAEYANGRYRTSASCDKPCDLRLLQEVESRRYTSMADLKFAAALARLPQSLQNRTQIRYVRDLQLEDFKQSNLILAGSLIADPWLSLLDHTMNFILHDDPSSGELRVENRKPNENEKKEYLFDQNDPQKLGLATISFLPNLGRNGNILLVQGFTLAGTDAAAEFVTSGKEFDSLFSAYSGNNSHLPHFEILLQTMDVNGMASRPTVLAWRTYP
jgi:hypothetical protein